MEHMENSIYVLLKNYALLWINTAENWTCRTIYDLSIPYWISTNLLTNLWHWWKIYLWPSAI
jgi:hypothetical protein